MQIGDVPLMHSFALINDLLPPVAIAQEISVTLIDSVVLTWVYATSFDGGSHDNCGIDSVLVRKSRVDTFATSPSQRLSALIPNKL